MAVAADVGDPVVAAGVEVAEAGLVAVVEEAVAAAVGTLVA